MKIDAIRTYHVSKPLKNKLRNSLYVIENMEHVLIEIDAGGYTGIGMVYSVHWDQSAALKVMIDGFAKRMLGKDSDLIHAHLKNANIINGASGPTGMPTSAWAAFDIALWDLLAQKANLPLYKILGAHSTEVPVYVSGGWLIPLEDLIQEAVAYKEQGYKCYKMKLGCKDYHEDLHRVKCVKEALGDSVEVYVDVNQGWSVKKAIMIAPMLRDLGVTYLEEPTEAHNYAGQAEIRANTDIQVVAGESLSSTIESFELMRNKGVDILNPDLQKCGGITNFMQVCAIANAFRIPVTSHTLTEVSAHLIAAAPTAMNVEYIPDWWDGIYDRKPNIKDGMLLLDNTPGIGYKFNHDYIAEHLSS